MNIRTSFGFFSSQKSLQEMVIDTFNYLYERSPINFSFLTGLHHPRIPRLMGNPFFGKALDVVNNPDGLFNILMSMAELARENSRGMAYKSIATIPSLIITRPTDIAQVLLFNGDKITRGIAAMRQIFGEDNLISLPDGAKWREKRNKLRQSIFSPESLQQLAPEMQKIIDDFGSELTEEGEIKSLEAFLIRLAMNVFAQTRMGAKPLNEKSVESIAQGLGKAMDAASSPINNIMAKLNSSISYLRSKYPKVFETTLDREKTALKNTLEKDFIHTNVNHIRITESLIKEYFDRNSQDDKAAFSEAYSDTSMYLLAGQETTERLLQFSMLLLKRHPAVLAELRKEIEDNRPRDNQWNKNTLDNMHYLGKIIKEVLRLYPPFPIIPRRVLEPLTLGDIPICHNRLEYEKAMAERDISKDIILSKGTALNISPLITQRLPSLYQNPLEFKPERFPSDSINLNADGEDMFCSFIPFGAGSRDCPGRMFAVQEAKLALIMFVDKFDFTTSLDDKPIETRIRGTLKLKEEVQVTFRPRGF